MTGTLNRNFQTFASVNKLDLTHSLLREPWTSDRGVLFNILEQSLTFMTELIAFIFLKLFYDEIKS